MINQMFIAVALSLVLLFMGCSENPTEGNSVDTSNTIYWQGEFSKAPETPELNWAFYNSRDNVSYIYNGTEWDTLSVDGVD